MHLHHMLRILYTDRLLHRNFTGSVANGVKRPPVTFIGNDLFLTDSITIEDFSLWTEEGTQVVNKINNAYGHGDNVYSPNNGLGVSNGQSPLPTFTHAVTVTTSPPGWVSPTFPAWAVASTGYGSALHLLSKEVALAFANLAQPTLRFQYIPRHRYGSRKATITSIM